MSTQERIDYCELCGRLDHHLVGDLCPSCRNRVASYDPHGTVRRAAALRRRENEHRELQEAAREIGGVLECPHWITAGLAGGVVGRGRRVRDLTVAELLSLIEAQRARMEEAFDAADHA